MPVQDGCRLTSPYTTARTLRGTTKPHSGTDFGGITPGRTSPILAPADGVVFLAGGPALPGRSGPPLAMRHDDGTATYWGHSRNMRVKVDQRVRRTDVLAETWHTGIPLAWGIHAHVENWADWRNHLTHRDPMPWLAANGWGTVIRDGATRLYDADTLWATSGQPLAAATTRTRQEHLKRHGIYTGLIDGQRGPLTITAEVTFLLDPPATDWSDMATEAEIRQIIREEITANNERTAQAVWSHLIPSVETGEPTRADTHLRYTRSLTGRGRTDELVTRKMIESVAAQTGVDPETIKRAAREGAAEAISEGVQVEGTLNVTKKEA